ncbi:MAG: hypothetical protein N3E51_03805 [Candidatus Micrarchaeota archaeon]|nr:hypothetical protein [Candidatus Micrarchaeota archaeon]
MFLFQVDDKKPETWSWEGEGTIKISGTSGSSKVFPLHPEDMKNDIYREVFTKIAPDESKTAYYEGKNGYHYFISWNDEGEVYILAYVKNSVGYFKLVSAEKWRTNDFKDPKLPEMIIKEIKDRVEEGKEMSRNFVVLQTFPYNQSKNNQSKKEPGNTTTIYKQLLEYLEKRAGVNLEERAGVNKEQQGGGKKTLLN